MKVETDVEHTDLDGDGDEDTPQTMVYVAVCMPDGMRYTGTVACDGAASVNLLSYMIVKAARGAGATHSPELGRLIGDRTRRGDR